MHKLKISQAKVLISLYHLKTMKY